MNWGYKILIVILLFIGSMSFMVSIAMKQNNDLQDEHYYVKELKHQELIDAESRFNALQIPLDIRDSNAFVYVHFPSIATNALKEGNIEFLRASDKTKDRVIKMDLNDENWQTIPKTELISGLYKLRIKWTNADKVYYTQQNIVLK